LVPRRFGAINVFLFEVSFHILAVFIRLRPGVLRNLLGIVFVVIQSGTSATNSPSDRFIRGHNNGMVGI